MKIINVKQGTDDWLRMRLGKITGTRLKSVMAGKDAQRTLMFELVAEQLTGQGEELYKSPAMIWGTQHEDEAVELYAKRTKSKPETVGFCVSDEFPYLALSPDRLIKKNKKYKKALEVKAPMSKTMVKYMYEGTLPKEYLWQVVNYFLVCDTLEELDFAVYDPRIIAEENKLWVLTVTREELQEKIEEAKERLVEFHAEWEQIYKTIHK